MTFPAARLAFTSIEDDREFPAFAVEASADGYSGATEVWISHGDWIMFLDQLDVLDSTLRGEARLRCGWVPLGRDALPEGADLDLIIRPYGQPGQLQADVTIRASARWTHRQSAHVLFTLPEPNRLTTFRRALREATSNPSAAPAVLSSDFREVSNREHR